MNVQRRPGRAGARSPFAAVDLDACTCVDTGHSWRWMDATAASGPLAGIPHHVYICMTCSSKIVRAEGWDGQVHSRDYQYDEVFIENARLLGDFYERRRNWRAERNRRLRAARLL